MKRLFLSLLVALALSVSAFAMEVPTDTVVQNLNGSQQLIKTYTLPPGTDPQQLIEEPFEQEGYRYTFAEIVKEENQVSDRKHHTETVTLETGTKDLGTILTQLAATLDYDDGTYSGVLTLDHTAIRTEASGYTSLQVTRKVFFWGLLFSLPFIWLNRLDLSLDRFAKPEMLFCILYLGLGASALCFAAWNKAVVLIGSVATNVYIYLMPVITLVASALILREPVTLFSVGAIGLIVLGLWLSQRKNGAQA